MFQSGFQKAFCESGLFCSTSPNPSFTGSEWDDLKAAPFGPRPASEHVRRLGAFRFLKALHELSQAGLAQLAQLGQTLTSWSVEIATMWRFTRNNGITEGFHTKMEVLQP
jgi:hypothetical protein